MDGEGTTSNQTKKGSGLILKIILFIAVFALGAGAMFFAVRTKPTVFGLSQNAQQAQADADALVAKVGKLISLPTDEKPTIATVTDAAKIKDQVFFRNSENGDKVLIYSKAAKAILYRESENRIIEVGSVNINNQPEATAVATPTPSGKAKATSSPQATPQASATPTQ